MTVDELLEKAFKKIGILTLENELLRDELNRLRAQVEAARDVADEVIEAEASRE